MKKITIEQHRIQTNSCNINAQQYNNKVQNTKYESRVLLTSMSFLGLRERCQYLQRPTGRGSTTPSEKLINIKKTVREMRIKICSSVSATIIERILWTVIVRISREKDRQRNNCTIRNVRTSGVDGLPDVRHIDPAGDLLDQHRRQTLGSMSTCAEENDR